MTPSVNSDMFGCGTRFPSLFRYCFTCQRADTNFQIHKEQKWKAATLRLRVLSGSIISRIIRIMYLFHLIRSGNANASVTHLSHPRIRASKASCIIHFLSLILLLATHSSHFSQAIGPNLTQFQVFYLPVQGPSFLLPSALPSSIIIFLLLAWHKLPPTIVNGFTGCAGCSETPSWD